MNRFQRYLAEEYAEDYWEGRIARRDALKVIAAVTGSMLLADSFLASCAPSEQSATLQATGAIADTPTPTVASPTASSAPTSAAVGTVMPDDPAIVAAAVEFPGEAATLSGYLARPSGDGSFPVVLVCHENRGLTDHIRDVARRVAKAGYVALAVDLLSREGGTEAVGYDNVPGALANLPPDRFVEDFASGLDFLRGQPFADAEHVGMVGFCFGGGVTWLVATRLPELLAAVPFYGPHPPAEDVAGIQAAVLAIYAGNDQRINAAIPDIAAAMQEHGKVYEQVVYPDVEHAFHNDTTPRYNADAAQDAWRRTLEWFDRYLRS